MARGLIQMSSIDEARYKTETRFIHRFAIDRLAIWEDFISVRIHPTALQI